MRRRRALDRTQVVQAAIDVVQAEGPGALGINRVARALGIKPPSLYNHVASGDDLTAAVVIAGNRALLEHLRRHDPGKAPPQARLSAFAVATRTWARSNPALYQVMGRAPVDHDHPEFAPLLAAMLDLLGEPLTALGLVGDEVIHGIRALRAAIHGFVLLETDGQFGLSQSVDVSFDLLIGALLDGLCARSPESVPPGPHAR